MFSFLGKIKTQLDIHQRVIPLITMKTDPSKRKYSQITDSSSSTNSAEIIDTPLTSRKNIKYESVIDFGVEQQQQHHQPQQQHHTNSSRRQTTSIEKNRGYKKSILQHVGHRLSSRKALHSKRRKVADVMFILGALGVLLMVWLIELNFSKQYEIKKKLLLEKQELVERYPYWDRNYLAVILKFLITFSTIVLVGLVFLYHHLDMKLYCLDNSIEDWRIAITQARIISVLTECLICAIHPIPGEFIVEWSSEEITTKKLNNSTITTLGTVTESIPLDIVLSIPMFARLYLLSRIILLHSKLVTDASSQSLGYLNRISFNFRFVFKAFMSQCPEYVLALLILILFLIASWGLKACEYHVNSEKFGFLNSMWLVAITFLTVG
jgi:potassium intermediate/small conductance calcium-activated channel subfamily N protein 3